jgi:D-apionolactonase
VSASTQGELRAGRLAAAMDGADLIDLRWGGFAAASRIQVTVRDRDWGTLTPSLLSQTVERSNDGFRVKVEAVHDDGAIGFSWRGTIEADDRALTFELDGVAERDSVYRRIGICVLHPWRPYVGARFSATTPAGLARGRFPEEIAPQVRKAGRYFPMIEAFSALAIEFPGGVAADLRFDGELFELEDQRNWTDPSFKSYPTPLARSEPRVLRRGERVRQRVAIALSGEPPAAVDDEGPAVIAIGRPNGRVVPGVGMSAPADPVADPAHLRVEVRAGHPDAAALAESAATALPLEIALLVEPDASDVRTVAPALAGLRIARILVHREDGETTPAELVAEVRDRLGAPYRPIPFVGGTADHFSELNRNPPDASPEDGISFAISPEAHAVDERSLMETIEIQRQVVRRSRELAGGAPILVTPVTLTTHLGTPFAEAWTVGSLAALINAGAASITCDASWRGVTHVAELRGAGLLEIADPQPLRIAALAVQTESGSRLLVANLTPAPRAFAADRTEQPPLAPYEVRTIGL